MYETGYCYDIPWQLLYAVKLPVHGLGVFMQRCQKRTMTMTTWHLNSIGLRRIDNGDDDEDHHHCVASRRLLFLLFATTPSFLSTSSCLTSLSSSGMILPKKFLQHLLQHCKFGSNVNTMLLQPQNLLHCCHHYQPIGVVMIQLSTWTID